MNVQTCRKKHLAEKIVFVDGLPGCGKTLMSPIIGSLERVELLTYAYELEYLCSTFYLEKLSSDAAVTLIRLLTDLRLYNQMMSREVNFRPSDLSSVLRDHTPTRYFERLFKPGDEKIPGVIEQERPILNLTTHQLLAYSEPIWQALGNRCVFVEVVRHPLYMVRQQELNMIRLLGDVRDFMVYIEYKGNDVPFYVHGWEEKFINSTPMEQTIHTIEQLTKHTEESKKYLKKNYGANIITIPFESFVLNPEKWMDKLANVLGTNITEITRKVMIEQNVPREKIADGIDLQIYRRCGWEPPKEGVTDRGELDARREDVFRVSSVEVMKILDSLTQSYEDKYWDIN